MIDNADYIAFTGSTATGREIGQRADERLIGCSLELGGKNPMIVLPDADLRPASAALPRASFANAGQLCMTTERVFVHESVIDEITELAVGHTNQIRLGTGNSFDYDMGSITARATVERFGGYLDQAVASGATVLTGGRPRTDIDPQWLRAHHPRRRHGIRAPAHRGGHRLRVVGQHLDPEHQRRSAARAAPRHPGLLRYTEAQTIAVQRLISIESRFGLPRRIHGEVLSRAVRFLKYLR